MSVVEAQTSLMIILAQVDKGAYLFFFCLFFLKDIVLEIVALKKINSLNLAS
jgi:hypothetical protein